MQHILDQLDLTAILDLITLVSQDEAIGIEIQLFLIE